MRPQEHSKIVILTDLGTFRAFRLSPKNNDSLAPHKGPAHLEELELPNEEWKSDRPGGFPQGKSIGETTSVSPGENHHEKSDHEKKRIAFLARKIETILSHEDSRLWCLAAPEAINKRLLSKVSPETCEFLAINLKADLTHISLRELEERFLNPPANS